MAERRRRPKAPPDPGERLRLLDAALPVSSRLWLSALSPADLCRAARLPPARFRAHFASLEEYLIAAQQRFMDGIRDRIVEGTTGTAAGFATLRAAAETYLDTCLHQATLRDWFIQARAKYPVLGLGLARQNHTYGVMMAGEFKHMGWPHPAAGARLYLAMVMEAGLAEHEAARSLPDVRETLWDYLHTYGG